MSIQDFIKRLQDMVFIYGDKIVLTITDGETEYRIKDVTGKPCAQYFESSDHISEVIVRIAVKNGKWGKYSIKTVTNAKEAKEYQIKADKEDRNEIIKVGDEVDAKLSSRRDRFKAVVIKIDKEGDPTYSICIMDKEGYVFWVSEKSIIKTGKAYPIMPILDMLAES